LSGVTKQVDEGLVEADQLAINSRDVNCVSGTLERVRYRSSLSRSFSSACRRSLMSRVLKTMLVPPDLHPSCGRTFDKAPGAVLMPEAKFKQAGPTWILESPPP
jgi:hypothetical protein